jgi:hypothetical protein
MAERQPKQFDETAVAKALRADSSKLADPAFGEGWHFQVNGSRSPLSLDTFPESGVSRITTKGARIELFGGMLPQVEDEGIVFLQKDSDHEHSTVSLSPNGSLTMGYQVDAGPVSVLGLPDNLEDTEQINAEHQAAQQPGETAPEDGPPAVVPTQKPPEKPADEAPNRTAGAFPDVRPMIQRVGTAEPAKTAEVATPQEAQGTPDTEAGEAERQRVKLVGRLGRTPSVRETATGKLVGKFPLAVHLEDGTTQWHNILAFGDRAAALRTRMESGELVKGNEIEVVGYLHEREYQGRDGTTKTAQEIYSVAVKRH